MSYISPVFGEVSTSLPRARWTGCWEANSAESHFVHIRVGACRFLSESGASQYLLNVSEDIIT